jgi:sugar lactone lactonase YvrE
MIGRRRPRSSGDSIEASPLRFCHALQKGTVMRITPLFLALVFAGAGLSSGTAPAQTQAHTQAQAQAASAARPEHRRADAVLQQAAQFEHQVTGVTISEQGRVFVNFPRWTEDSPVSVAEVMKDGSLRPYPDAQWNAWRNVRRDELDPSTHWVCVQSVVADGRGSVWVVDPAAPAVDGIVPGGPKLVRIDLATDRVAQVIQFGQDVAIPGSYLNDVRFSKDGKYAYLTDAGQRGALVVVDLSSGKARRVLDGHPSTQPEKGVVVHTDGKPLRYPDGRPVLFAADSIALSNDGAWLYYKPLTAYTLYRIRTAALTSGLAGEDVSSRVQPFGRLEPTDGFWIDRGRGTDSGTYSDTLYITSIQDNAIKARNLAQGPAGAVRTVVQDPRLRWPDTFSQGPDGSLYVTTSRIQDSAFFNRDAPLALPTQLWRLPRPRDSGADSGAN